MSSESLMERKEMIGLPELEGSGEPDTLEIYTLGRFEVRKENRDLLTKAKRSSKLWELFKFFITNRNKHISSDNIIDSLWPDQDYCDQGAALHTLTHRLRRHFYDEFSSDKKPFTIEVNQGCYVMQLSDNCRLDCDDFAALSLQAVQLRRKNPEAAVEMCRRAVSLYRGEYLPEYSSKKWLLAPKRHYRSLYLQTLLAKINMLAEMGLYSAVCSACERAFQVEAFVEVEALQIVYLEALVKCGKEEEALCHYDFLDKHLQQDYGTNPSPAMSDLCRRIKSTLESTSQDLGEIDERLKERESVNGAFICDRDFFRFLYRLETRRSERKASASALGLFTISWDDYQLFDKEVLNGAMNKLESRLLRSLRKGDVITRWSESQYLALLLGVDHENINAIFKRVKSSFDKAHHDRKMTLEVTRKTAFL